MAVLIEETAGGSEDTVFQGLIDAETPDAEKLLQVIQFMMDKKMRLKGEKEPPQQTGKNAQNNSMDEWEQLIAHADKLFARGIELDEQKRYYYAVRYFEKALEVHHVDAILKLALYYEIGRGVRKDKKRALELYETALNHGSEEAVFLVGQLLEKMGELEKAKEYYEDGKDSGCECCTARLTVLNQTPPVRTKPGPNFKEAMDLYHGLNGVVMDRTAAVEKLYQCVEEDTVDCIKAKTFLGIMSKWRMSEVYNCSTACRKWYDEFVSKRLSFKRWYELEEMIVKPTKKLCSFHKNGHFERICTGSESSFKNSISKSYERKFILRWTQGWEIANTDGIPVEIGMCACLEILHCYTNRLTSLPKEVGQCTHLQYLDCSNNQLTSLPKEVGQYTQLKHLRCGDNCFMSLPEEIKQLEGVSIFRP
eukprot:Nk52_evm9s267 gene=Nk52_evmTU9s267